MKFGTGIYGPQKMKPVEALRKFNQEDLALTCILGDPISSGQL